MQPWPPACAVFTGIGVLLTVRSSVLLIVGLCDPHALQATKDVRSSHDVLIDLFERIQYFLKRLGVHTRILPTEEMVEILVKIMAEVLSILSIATKEVQQSRTSKLLCLSSQLTQPLSNLIRNIFEKTRWNDGY